MSGPSNTIQFTDKVLGILESSLVKDRGIAMSDSYSTPSPGDTDIGPKPFHVSFKSHSCYSANEMTKFGQNESYGADEAPDSPCTLLGDEVDLDEICSPLSLGSSGKSFIPETPPSSPSTLLGDRSDLDETTNSIANRGSEADDQPASPSTVLGDKFSQEELHSPSSTPSSVLLGLGEGFENGGMATYTSQQYAPTVGSSSAARHYMQWPSFTCEAVSLIDEWPAFVVKAFMDEDWKFGLGQEGKIVLELVDGRNDLVKWFTEIGEKWQYHLVEDGTV